MDGVDENALPEDFSSERVIRNTKKTTPPSELKEKAGTAQVDVELGLNVSVHLNETATTVLPDTHHPSTEKPTDEIKETTENRLVTETSTAADNESTEVDENETTEEDETTTTEYQTIVETSSSFGYGENGGGIGEIIYFTTNEPIIEEVHGVKNGLEYLPPYATAWSGAFRPSNPDYIEENLLAIFHPTNSRL